MDSVARGTAVNVVTRTLAVLGVLAVTTVAARLSTQAQGVFALFTSVEAGLVAAGSGFGIALARRISHHGERPRGWLSAMALACVALGVAAAVALWGVATWGPPAYAYLWLLALAAPVLLLTPNVAGWWLGEGRMAPMARLALAPPYVALALIALAWAGDRRGVAAVLGAWVAAKVAVGIGLCAVLWRRGRFGTPDFAALRADAGFVATIGATNLLSLANYRVGLFVVESQLGLAATGVYSIAVVVTELLWFVSSSLTQAAYARIGAADRSRAAATTLRVAQLGVAALLVVAPLLWLAASLFVPAWFGAAYRASLAPLALLLPGALLFGGASALSAYFTNHAGRPQVAAQVALLSLVVNAVLAIGLVPRFGIAGAAVAASLAYAAGIVVLTWRFARHAGVPLKRVWQAQAQLAGDLADAWRALRRRVPAARPPRR